LVLSSSSVQLAVSLRCTGLRRKFGETLAVSGVDLEVSLGETVGLVGPNGAGKTTFLRCLLGLLAADSGTAWIHGLDTLAQHSEAMRFVAFVPETPGPVGYLTPREHLVFVARAFQLAPGWDARAATILRSLDLEEKATRPASELSKGQKQKVHLAMAMLRDPELLILDEPLIGLDPKAAYLLKTWILERRKTGKATLASSHSLSFVEEIATRVVVLDRGHVIADGTIEALRQRAALVPGTPLEQIFLRITGA
jgi:ABC-2 type transport system ATP-binding protein